MVSSVYQENDDQDDHYIMEKRHMMLCRLAIWNYHKRLLTNDNAEYDAMGMLNKTRCVRGG